MEERGAWYAFRQAVREHLYVSLGFIETVKGYVIAEDVDWTFVTSQCDPPTLMGMYTHVPNMLPYGWNRFGYYNNFFIARMDLYRDPRVQRFVKYIDRTGGIYRYRWNDLLVQSMVVQLYLDKEQIIHFGDWTYEHATYMKNGTFSFGGFAQGTADTNYTLRDRFLEENGALEICVGGAQTEQGFLVGCV